MTQKISDTKSVIDFFKVATMYCTLLETRDQYSGIEFIQKTFVIIPTLCLNAMHLPVISRFPYKWLGRIPESELYNALRNKLKKINRYKQIFDPWDTNENKPSFSTLSNDFVEIYEELKPGLIKWDKANAAEKCNIIWQWKWGFENHWGDHATVVFRALYALLYSHLEDKNGDYVGIRELGR